MQVFISHDRADVKWVDLIREKLRDSTGPRSFHVWDWDSDIQPGDNWALKLGEALESSDAMIVLLSPRSVKSRWVRQEIDFALTNPRFSDRLISVMIEPTRDVPWILQTLPFIDGTKDSKTALRDLAALLEKVPERRSLAKKVLARR